MHVDTGAKYNVFSQSVLQTLKLEKSVQKSNSFSRHTMKSKGRVVIPFTFYKETFNDTRDWNCAENL